MLVVFFVQHPIKNEISISSTIQADISFLAKMSIQLLAISDHAYFTSDKRGKSFLCTIKFLYYFTDKKPLYKRDFYIMVSWCWLHQWFKLSFMFYKMSLKSCFGYLCQQAAGCACCWEINHSDLCESSAVYIYIPLPRTLC